MPKISFELPIVLMEDDLVQSVEIYLRETEVPMNVTTGDTVCIKKDEDDNNEFCDVKINSVLWYFNGDRVVELDYMKWYVDDSMSDFRMESGEPEWLFDESPEEYLTKTGWSLYSQTKVIIKPQLKLVKEKDK